MARAGVLLPQPDSPTNPSVLTPSTSRPESATAWAQDGQRIPPRTGNRTDKFRTSNRLMRSPEDGSRLLRRWILARWVSRSDRFRLLFHSADGSGTPGASGGEMAGIPEWTEVVRFEDGNRGRRRAGHGCRDAAPWREAERRGLPRQPGPRT